MSQESHSPSLSPDGRPSWRAGPRAFVLAGTAAIVIVMALIIADRVAGQLRRTAVDAALGNVETIVRGYVDPVLVEDSLGLDAQPDPAIDRQLERLTVSGNLLEITVWSRDGRAVYSSVPAMRGHRMSIDHALAVAFAGDSVAVEAPVRDADESSVDDLRILVPIRGAVDGNPIGVYEVLQDGRPIATRVEDTRTEVFLTASGASTILLLLLWLAFAGASRTLAGQNRLLREQAIKQESLTADLRRSEERFRSLVRNASDAVLIIHADGTVGYESPAVERVLGYTVDERRGRPALDILHPEDAAFGQRLLDAVRRAPGAEAEGELRARHADGSWRVIEAVAKNLLDVPAVGGIVLNYRDVTERKELERQLAHQAFHDRLTGLANRALFLDRLEHARTRASRSPAAMAVLFLDLDDFKAINDRFGHATGDEALRVAATRIAAAVRPGDTVARIGGDEFAILIEDAAAAAQAEDVAERVLERLRKPFRAGGSEVVLRASVGVAEATTTDSADELLRNADIAMYRAKSDGKGRIVRFHPALRDSILGRIQLKADLQLGLERGEFTVAYQPIVDLRTGSTVGFEALARWNHPRHGPISPTEFIPLAEESGAIIALGRWVLEEATRQTGAWQRASGRALTISVNVSARQVANPGLVAEVAAALEAADLQPASLMLEITEGALVGDTESAIAILTSLRGLGVRLAIDDFGTGYSSLNYLRELPVDVIKIDRSFVAEVNHGAEQRAVLRSILDLARTLHLETIAEGIEDSSQLDKLTSLGTTLGQGFYFARPIRSDEVADFLGQVSPVLSPVHGQPKTGRAGVRTRRPVIATRAGSTPAAKRRTT
jgi:diguanylate cyclase (GGDEF)-like protein/PAS domain S-box-containing protein